MLYVDTCYVPCNIAINTLKYLCAGSQPALGKALLAIIDKQSDPSPEDQEGAKRKSRRSEAHTEKSAVKGIEDKVSSLVCNVSMQLHIVVILLNIYFMYVFYIIHTY